MAVAEQDGNSGSSRWGFHVCFSSVCYSYLRTRGPIEDAICNGASNSIPSTWYERFSESATKSLLLSLFSSIHRKPGEQKDVRCLLSPRQLWFSRQSSGVLFPPVPAEANLIEVVEQMGMNSTVKS